MGASSSFGPGSSSISRRHRTIVGWLATNHTSRSISSAPITTRVDVYHAAAAQEPPVYGVRAGHGCLLRPLPDRHAHRRRSEEHTSELQSRLHLVCRLLLEKKKNKDYPVSQRIPEAT